MKNTQYFTILFVSFLAWAGMGNSPLAMPQGDASSPASSFGATEEVLLGEKEDSANAVPADPMEAFAVPAVVLKVDGVPYSGELFRGYVRNVLERRATTEKEFFGYLDDMALDIAGYDLALKEMPALKDDISVAHATAKLKSKLLPPVYVEEEVRKKVNPTREELVSRLPDPPARYEVSVIVNPEEAKIDEAVKALSAGEPFDRVAGRLSEGFTAGKGGKLGAIVEGKYDLFTEAEFRIVKPLRDGEVSKPFMSRIGWTILRLDKYWSPAEQKRQDVEQNYGKYKAEAETARARELFAEIQRRSQVAWNDNNLSRIKAAVDNNLPVTGEMISSEVFRVNGVPFYALEFETMGRFHSSEALNLYFEKRMLLELVAQETERLGYGKEVEPLVDLARRRTVTRQFFKLKSREFAPKENDLRAYYEKNKEKFNTEETRRLLVIETPDKKKAEEAYRKARKGGDFRKLVATYSYREEQRKLHGDAGFVSRKNLDPPTREKVFGAKKGAILGPLELKAAEGGIVYAVLKVDAIRKPALRPFDQVNRQVIADRIVAARMEEFHKHFTDAVSKAHWVEILGQTGGGDK